VIVEFLQKEFKEYQRKPMLPLKISVKRILEHLVQQEKEGSAPGSKRPRYSHFLEGVLLGTLTKACSLPRDSEQARTGNDEADDSDSSSDSVEELEGVELMEVKVCFDSSLHLTGSLSLRRPTFSTAALLRPTRPRRARQLRLRRCLDSLRRLFPLLPPPPPWFQARVLLRLVRPVLAELYLGAWLR
jgi:hypothetical protein